MDTTISLGHHLTSSNDRMEITTLVDLYESISHADSALSTQQEILRSVRDIDSSKYSQLKRALPYFVCAKFENGLRRIENFSHLEAFILDIDHFEDTDVSLEELKKHIAQDERVAMAFISPSGNGLKVLFFLDKPCKDANIYTSFYKRFAVEFAKEYHLENYIDYKTCDVTRACFLASDVNATLNLNFIAIHMDDYVNTEAVDLFVHDDKLVANECQALVAAAENAAPKNIDPNQETMNKIKERLEMSKKRLAAISHQEIYVPKEIKEIFDGLKVSVEETGVELYETKDIQYGMKLCFRVNLVYAELNLFFGKRGFTVVESPKRGTSSELNSMMAELVRAYITEHTTFMRYGQQLRIG